jgi:hypothetical protein
VTVPQTLKTKERAEAHFKKEERGSKQMSEYKAAREAERARRSG